MNVETHFSWEWKALAGKSCLYVAPHETVDSQRWISFFEEVEGAFPDGEAFVCIDIRHINDEITPQGLNKIIDILMRQGVKRAVFAVVTTDEFHDLTVNMFEALADISDFKLQVRIFFNDGSARDWMEERIAEG